MNFLIKKRPYVYPCVIQGATLCDNIFLRGTVAISKNKLLTWLTSFLGMFETQLSSNQIDSRGI